MIFSILLYSYNDYIFRLIAFKLTKVGQKLGNLQNIFIFAFTIKQ